MDDLIRVAAIGGGVVLAGAGWRWASKRWIHGDTVIRLGLLAFILLAFALSTGSS